MRQFIDARFSMLSIKLQDAINDVSVLVCYNMIILVICFDSIDMLCENDRNVLRASDCNA